MTASKTTRTFNLRFDAETHELVHQAAEICGQSATVFITEAAVYSAQVELLDQRFVGVDPTVFDDVLAQIDAPAEVNAELVRLFRQQLEWIE
ncbi:DUF1778 domain-containing protein [Nitratireductor mangrovi]|uniref:DUF1778 domain-containing protein n=1 Tax=Nitratireductor mangrovi TaxID=2599600 RepID=A0A5B8KY43_9HYPH|nr:DUF1778 domain-containing protein [Nitratireductor mangrovi]QDZ00523.2 DUF1778 domain-containing protein [Nitratireductor mangrovi]